MIKYIKIVPRMAVQFLLEENEFAINKVLYGDTKTPWGLISIFGVTDKEGANGYREHNYLVTPDKIPTLQKLGCELFHNSCFMDITKEQYEKHNRTIYMENMLFDEIRAKAIVDWVDYNKNNLDRLVCHCDAGVSRSGAVGLWATRYLGLDEKKYCESNPSIQPNQHVLKTLSDVSGMSKDYEDFWMQNLTTLDTTWENLF